METVLPATLHKLIAITTRTGFSRSSLYREIYNQQDKNGNIRINPQGRLKVVYLGRSIRVREQDLADFIDALAKG